ncbi:hypothetical protein Barb6_00107 [Bacteroidales bacterium Barb6]|nr:hypothetical protein Barb6_00107 [Bacteroidales bacterium Barb6]
MKYIVFSLLLCSAQLFAQTSGELKSWLPAVDGWTVSDEVEVFDPVNLFDRINGAAPLFIENNFQEMTSLEYKKGKDYIVIQAYRHATPEDAFGMYASERSSELEPFAIGGEAQGDKSGLFFFAGSMYIKMWSYANEDTGQLLQIIGKGLADKIDPQVAYPSAFQAFPAEGKEPYSEAYITANYLGHQFLKGAYTANYKKDGKPFQLFVINGKSREGVKEILTNYFTFTKQPLDFQEGSLLIEDRYNGNVPAIWKGQYLIGIYSENGDAVEAKDLLQPTADKLQ